MKIQKIQRGNVSRKHDQQKKDAVIKIQSVERGRRCRQDFEVEQKRKQAAVKIQKMQRGKVARKEVELERERQKEEKANRFCFPKRGGISSLCASKNGPQKTTGKSSRLRTYQLCHAEAKRQTQKDAVQPVQPKPKVQAPRPGPFAVQKSASRSVTPAGTAGTRVNAKVTGTVPRSVTPNRSAAKTPLTPRIPKAPAQPIAAAFHPGSGAQKRQSRSATPTPGAKPRPRPSAGSSAAVYDFASSAQKMLGCQRVAARLAESKKKLAEQQASVAKMIQACLRSRLEIRRLERLRQKHSNAAKIQAGSILPQSVCVCVCPLFSILRSGLDMESVVDIY